jgi:DNA-binding MarR family transcriptional regulator
MMVALMTVVRSTGRAQRKGAASRLAMLAVIAACPESSPKAISEELGVHASSVTRQVQALEREGVVKVTADPADGRSCRVRLTAAGRAELERLRRLGMERYASFVAGWEAEEVRTLARLLEKLEQSKAETARTTKLVGGRWRKVKKT